jgi:hypothetical protein
LVDGFSRGGNDAGDIRSNRGSFFTVLGVDFGVVGGLGGVDGGGSGVGRLAWGADSRSDSQGLVGQQGVAAVFKEGGVVLSAAVESRVSDVVLLVLLEVASSPTSRSGLGDRRRGNGNRRSVGDGKTQGDKGRKLSEHVVDFGVKERVVGSMCRGGRF